MNEEKTKSSILDITSEHVDILFKKWSLMFDNNYCCELMTKLEGRVRSVYADLLAESNEKEQAIRDGISALLAETADLRRLLHKQLDIGEMPENVPLTVWEQKLDDSIRHLREEMRERRAEICELLLQQDQLCEELGVAPLPLLADPLPKPEEMSAFCDNLDHLRAERMRRMEELFQLRSQIKQDMMVLGIRLDSAADEHLLSQANQSLTPDIFEKLKFMQKEFAAQMAELRERMDDMRQKIYVLWERLQISDELATQKVREATEYSQYNYDVLQEELHRCQTLRRKNLKSLIDQLRLDINKWWDLTLKSQQERKRFANFYNEFYNEDLLELHELELDDLQQFYNDNKAIFDLFSSRAECWARMEALEAKANDPNRFNNRGGQLLKEERERKAIGSKLPKIEKQISELVKAYELRTNSPFLVHGENILEHMANDWERLRLAKEQQCSARKHTGSTSTIRGKAGSAAPRTPMSLRNMSAMSSSTMSLFKTPEVHMSSKPGWAAKTTGNMYKRKMQVADSHTGKETETVKRSLLKALNSSALRKPNSRLAVVQKKTAKSPRNKVLVLETTMRRSSGLANRSQSGKKRRNRDSIPGIRLQPPTSDENEDGPWTYQNFKPPARSSEMPQPLIDHHKKKLKQPIQTSSEDENELNPSLPEPRRSRMLFRKN